MIQTLQATSVDLALTTIIYSCRPRFACGHVVRTFDDGVSLCSCFSAGAPVASSAQLASHWLACWILAGCTLCSTNSSGLSVCLRLMLCLWGHTKVVLLACYSWNGCNTCYGSARVGNPSNQHVATQSNQLIFCSSQACLPAVNSMQLCLDPYRPD